MCIIELNQIKKKYSTEYLETFALDGVYLRVEAGEFIAVTGPSGSGKSTLLNVLGLLDEADEGSYVIDGCETRGLSDRAASKLRNQKIGFVFQSFNLMKDLTVFENIELPMRYRAMLTSERRDRAERALQLVGLGNRARHSPHQLSGGQQQRVAVARAIAGGPALLLADEPTGNLDSERARSIMDLLGLLNDQGMTIVMVTHSDASARRAGRVLQMFDGRVCDVSGGSESERPSEYEARTPTAEARVEGSA